MVVLCFKDSSFFSWEDILLFSPSHYLTTTLPSLEKGRRKKEKEEEEEEGKGKEPYMAAAEKKMPHRHATNLKT